jgi:acetoin utilization deacetylase AcuC-like enzyme
MGQGHPEQPARVQVIEEKLKNSSLNKLVQYYEAPLVENKNLLLVHDKNYVDSLFKMSPENGLVSVDPDTFMNPFTLQAARRAAGAVILGVDLVMSKKAEAVFCNVRPPGHHAEKNRAMGFCFFNNVAIGAAYALEQYKLNRIAIIDFDVHHGNGTQDIFQNEDRVLLCSSFQHPFYPFSGNKTNNHIINIPLSPETSGKVFREKIEELWLDKINDFKPEMIFFSAGFDGHCEDDMSSMVLIDEDYAWVTGKIRNLANQHCPGRIVSVLEGGYALDALARSAYMHIQAMQDQI